MDLCKSSTSRTSQFAFFARCTTHLDALHINMKKRSERRKHCTLAVEGGAKKFAPPQTPFPGAQNGQNLISWRWSLPLPTYPVWSGSIHAILSYHGNRPTNKQTHRQDRLQYTAPQLASAQCNYVYYIGNNV